MAPHLDIPRGRKGSLGAAQAHTAGMDSPHDSYAHRRSSSGPRAMPPPGLNGPWTDFGRSDSQPSGSGREASDQTQTRRGKEPNGAAQKRHRERQKTLLVSLEHDYEHKVAEWSALAQQNNQLKARARLLQQVVLCREEQVEMLGEHIKQTKQRAAATAACASSLLQQQRASSNGGAHHLKHGTNGVGYDHHQQQQNGHQLGVVHLAAPLPAAANAHDTSRFRAMRKEDVVAAYKAFVADVAEQLLQAELQNGTVVRQRALSRVEAAVGELGLMIGYLLMANPLLMKSLLGTNLDTNAPEEPPEGHWDRVVSALQLSAEQCSDSAGILDMYTTEELKLSGERQMLLTALYEGAELADAQELPGCDRSPSPQDMEVAERLHANVTKEYSSVALICCAFFGRVLEPVQFAKVALQSYPWFPNSVSVATAVVEAASAALAASPSPSPPRPSNRSDGKDEY